MITATLKTSVQKFEKPILLFSKTHEAAVRNRKILSAFKGELDAAIAAQKDIPENYRYEFRDIASSAKLLLHH